MAAQDLRTAHFRTMGCLLVMLLAVGCGTSSQESADAASAASAEVAAAEAKDECRDRLNAAVRRVSPESLGTQTRRDSVVNAMNSWLASCAEADVKALSVSEANAKLLSETSLRTAKAVRFSENDVIYVRDCMLLKGLTESIWKQVPTGDDQSAAEVRRVTLVDLRLDRLRQREERAIGEVVAVDQEERRIARRAVIEIELLPGQRLRHVATVCGRQHPRPSIRDG